MILLRASIQSVTSSKEPGSVFEIRTSKRKASRDKPLGSAEEDLKECLAIT